MRRLKITQKNNNFLKPGSIHYVWFGDNIFCHITKFVIFGLLFWLLLYVAKILPFPVHVGSMSLIVLFWISLICLIFIKLCYRVVKKLWQYVKHGATAAEIYAAGRPVVLKLLKLRKFAPVYSPGEKPNFVTLTLKLNPYPKKILKRHTAVSASRGKLINRERMTPIRGSLWLFGLQSQ